ncbi:hypothetical protein [Luteimonas saliphila]|uniref:hypothetical protein n=1 Tax=Luteimonas saliphila TaxID=2804919 RepID=UPI00192DECB0|nr:hypothetical protein [Luteimonas saliphila]
MASTGCCTRAASAARPITLSCMFVLLLAGCGSRTPTATPESTAGTPETLETPTASRVHTPAATSAPTPPLASYASSPASSSSPASPPPPARADGRAISPEGVYAMAPPLGSELRVVALPGRAGEYRIEVHGGGDPVDGAGVAADCQAVAEGPLEGGRIDATLVPFESDIGGLDATDLQSAPRMVLTLQGDRAQLEGGFEHCPMGTAMAGTYRRTAATKLFEACAPLPAACWNRD